MIIFNEHNALVLQPGYKLKSQGIISRVVASVLLMVTLLSVTPKSLLHHILANHSDQPTCNDNIVNGPCIHRQGFNCEQASLVVPGGYTMDEATITKVPRLYFANKETIFIRPALAGFSHAFHLRGPPAHV